MFFLQNPPQHAKRPCLQPVLSQARACVRQLLATCPLPPCSTGKTAQSIASLESIRAVAGIRGPFLIVAPLTTLGHWQREVETWTDMVR